MAVEKKRIIIVGCGPGSVDLLPPAAAAAAGKADVLIVSKRLEGLFTESSAERIDAGADIAQTLEIIARQRDMGKQVVLLATGDPGIFSLAQPVIRHFGRENCEVIPGISSIQVAFARIGLSWEDVTILSAHKEDPRISADELRPAGKIAILGGRTASLHWIAGLLKELGDGRRVFLCEELTLPDEKITEVKPDELTEREVSTRVIVLAVKRELFS